MQYRVEGEKPLTVGRQEQPLVEVLEKVARKWLALHLLSIGDRPDGRYEVTLRFAIEPNELLLGETSIEPHAAAEKHFEFCQALQRALDCRPQFGEEVRVLTREQGERVRAVLKKEFG